MSQGIGFVGGHVVQLAVQIIAPHADAPKIVRFAVPKCDNSHPIVDLRTETLFVGCAHAGNSSFHRNGNAMRAGDKAWLAIGTWVVVWDVIAPPKQMLSERSKRYRETHPIMWCGLVVYVAGHLIHVWPHKADPLTRLAAAAGR